MLFTIKNIKIISINNKILNISIKYCNHYKLIQLCIILLTINLQLLGYILSYELKCYLIKINNTITYKLLIIMFYIN